MELSNAVAELKEARKTLMPLQDKLVEEMQIDPELVAFTTEELRERGLLD